MDKKPQQTNPRISLRELPRTIHPGAAPVNPPTRWNPTTTIIYDWAPVEIPEVKAKLDQVRAEPYILVYQNIDPDSAKTGIINPDLIIREIRAKHGENPGGWGMLDYEEPFDRVLQSGPDNPEYGKCTKSMLGALEAVRQAFPRVRWTYYGMPGLSYWPGGKLWAFADEGARQAEIERQIVAYGSVLRELDWYSPCVYDVYDLNRFGQREQASHLVNEREYRLSRVGVVRELLRREGLGHRPVLPAVSPFFAPGGNAVENQRIPPDELVRDQIAPLVAAGCDGVCIWSAAQWYGAQAVRPDDPRNKAQARVRPVFTRDYFGGTEPQWTDPQTRVTLWAGLGNAIADMAVAAGAEWRRPRTV